MLKKVIKDCLHCKRLRTKPISPLMGDLPYDRIEIGQPQFYSTKIDYFGPILTKSSRRTRSTTGKAKWWGALSTCLNQGFGRDKYENCADLRLRSIAFSFESDCL